jgi:hypothetical protein
VLKKKNKEKDIMDEVKPTDQKSLLKKHVPGASQMTQAQVVMAAVNNITILEETIRKMREENSTVALLSPMDCTYQPLDLTTDSSDSLSPVHEDSFT